VVEVVVDKSLNDELTLQERLGEDGAEVGLGHKAEIGEENLVAEVFFFGLTARAELCVD